MKKLVIDGNKIKLSIKIFSGCIGIIMGVFEIFSAYKSYKASKTVPKMDNVLKLFKK